MSVPVYREPEPRRPSGVTNSRQNVVFIILFGHGVAHGRCARADFVQAGNQAVQGGFIARVRCQVV